MSNTALREAISAHVCSSEQSLFLDPNKFCSTPDAVVFSPIDEFRNYLAAIIPTGNPESIESNPILGKVLLLGVVSAAEHYFRSVVAGLVYACPLSRKHAAIVNIAFGAVDYYKPEELGFAFLEGVSLATPGEIGKQTLKITGLGGAQSGSAQTALKEYEKLYHLRHAAVHSRGELGSQNLRELGITGSGRKSLTVSSDGFQIACAICLNAVRAYNRAIFSDAVERLMIRGSLTGEWRNDRIVVRKLHSLFHSAVELGQAERSLLIYKACLPALARMRAGPPSLAPATSTLIATTIEAEVLPQVQPEPASYRDLRTGI